MHATHAHHLTSSIWQLFPWKNGNTLNPLPTSENQPQSRSSVAPAEPLGTTSEGWGLRLLLVAVVDSGLNTDRFVLGLPCSPGGNLQPANLCNCEIICIVLSGVMSYCSSQEDSLLLAQSVSSSGRGKAVGRVGARLDLRLGLFLLLQALGSCFQGSRMLGITFNSQHIFLKHLSEALWVVMGF